MSEMHDAVVAQLRQDTNISEGRPPWTTISGLCGSLHPDIDPETVKHVLDDLERDDNRQGQPVVARFEWERGYDRPFRCVVLLGEGRIEATANRVVSDPDQARSILDQLAGRNPAPKGLIGAINESLMETAATDGGEQR